MATIARQPFAPLDGARLQSLTSLKNRQNALPSTSPGKRKASEVGSFDDFENVDPVQFAKRSKGSNSSSLSGNDYFKPFSFILTKAASTPNVAASAFAHPEKSLLASSVFPPSASSRPRTILQPKSPAAKLNISLVKPAPLSAPAGRSPTRGAKRIGLLGNRRRSAGFGRVEPPSFGLGGLAPFSLDAALQGTLSHSSNLATAASSAPAQDFFPASDTKDSWFFDIHEDTPEQELTNMLQHGTCVLDISSDEENELKARRDHAEGRDKENVPPVDDVSQTRLASALRAVRHDMSDDMMVEKMRRPLSEVDPADYYAVGCDESSVFLIFNDEATEKEEEAAAAEHYEAQVKKVDELPVVSEAELQLNVDELMGKVAEPDSKAAVLEPIEGTGESFELWESGSAKDDAEPRCPASPATQAVTVALA